MNAEIPIPSSVAETTDLERRVLAHERILQSLIAYMSETEPRFIDHLRRRFVEPMSTERREHHHTDTDAYAEEFILAVMLLGDDRAKAANGSKLPEERHPAGRLRDPDATQPFAAVVTPDRVQVRERSGIWEVKVDGVFRGDYSKKENALAAAALARLSPVTRRG